MCPTPAYCATCCGAIPTRKSRSVGRARSNFPQTCVQVVCGITIVVHRLRLGLGRKWSWREFHIRRGRCVKVLADAWLGADLPWSSGNSHHFVLSDTNRVLTPSIFARLWPTGGRGRLRVLRQATVGHIVLGPQLLRRVRQCRRYDDGGRIIIVLVPGRQIKNPPRFRHFR